MEMYNITFLAHVIKVTPRYLEYLYTPALSPYSQNERNCNQLQNRMGALFAFGFFIARQTKRSYNLGVEDHIAYARCCKRLD